MIGFAVSCPAVTGKIRCPLRPASMTLDRDRPEILQPPEHPQACCVQQTVTAKDPASNTISRGWCRLTGLAPLMLFTTMLLTVRNQRILTAWNTRQEENQRRAAAGLPARTRRRRRKSLAMTTAAGPP